MKNTEIHRNQGFLARPFFDAYFYKEGGMPYGDQGTETNAYSHQDAGGESGQTPAEYKRAKACEESAELSEVAGAGSKEGMAAACKADGTDRHPDRGGYGGVCRILPGLCPVERGGGIHYPARLHCKDTVRLLAAGAAGFHCADLLEDHEPVCRAVRPDTLFPEPDHCRR